MKIKGIFAVDISIVSKNKSSLELEISDQDQALIAIVHHELIASKNVQFAAFKAPHPLLKKILLKIDTKVSDPFTELSSSCKTASTEIKKLSVEASKIVGGGGD